MQSDSDVNPAFERWKSLTGKEKEWALRLLIPKLEKFATAICWQRLPDHKDDFKALVNGIIWRALKRAHKFKGDSKFSTWFYKITTNECNRYLRCYKKRCEIDLAEEMPGKAEAVDARIDLIALLSCLEGDDHVLFRLVAEGEDFATIGERLGLTRNAALVRWTRLKERLRDAL